jgi:aquaporin Z
MDLLKKAVSEFVGTMVLVVIGCGVAIVTNGSLVETSLAFGLSLTAMAYSIGNVSGCHITPAVSFGFLLSKRMSAKDFFVYVLAQTVGAIVGAAILLAVFHNLSNNALGSNTVNPMVLGSTSTGEPTIGALFLGLAVETILTFVFVLLVLSVTSKKENASIAGVVIGLALTSVHLLGISLTGTSVNPARSIGPALLALAHGVTAPIQEIWIFIVGPLFGAALAALCFRLLIEKKTGEKDSARIA